MADRTYLMVFYTCKMPAGISPYNDDGSPNERAVQAGIEMTKRAPLLNLVFTASDNRPITIKRLHAAMRGSYLNNADDAKQEAFGNLLDTLRRVYIGANGTYHYYRDDNDTLEHAIEYPNLDRADIELMAIDTIRTGAFVADDENICMVRLVEVCATYKI